MALKVEREEGGERWGEKRGGGKSDRVASTEMPVSGRKRRKTY